MRARLLLAGAVIIALIAIDLRAEAAQPSFDCAKAGNWAEKQICKSDDLAALDAWFGPLYGQVAQRLPKADADALRAQRKAWLKTRNACKDDKDGVGCLTARYREIIADLEQRLVQLVGGTADARSAAPTDRPPLEECAAAEANSCLEELLGAAETTLATAEAQAAGDRVAESNLAWRAYRNAECKRRQGVEGDGAKAAALYAACLVELTRRRTAELQPRL